MNRSITQYLKENTEEDTILDKTKKYIKRNWKKYGVGIGVTANILGSALTWNEINKLKQNQKKIINTNQTTT